MITLDCISWSAHQIWQINHTFYFYYRGQDVLGKMKKQQKPHKCNTTRKDRKLSVSSVLYHLIVFGCPISKIKSSKNDSLGEKKATLRTRVSREHDKDRYTTFP